MKKNTTLEEIKEYCLDNACDNCEYASNLCDMLSPCDWEFEDDKTLVVEMTPEKIAEIGKIEVNMKTDLPKNHIVVYLKGGSHED